MKKKYIITLSIIVLLLVGTLSLGTGYGLWLSSKNTEESNIQSIDCFKVYYDNNGIIELSKIKPVLETEGESTSPYTITITNTCEDAREVQIRLNTTKQTTVNVNALTITTAGDIELPKTLYKNLENTKTSEEEVSVSRLLGKAKIEPNETIRTNVRLWFDEKKLPTVQNNKNYYKGHIEIIDSERAIKPTLYETILKDPQSIDKKAAHDYGEISVAEDGMYSIAAPNGKYYYYRGVVTNNYVKFGNNVWRIVGVNPDKSIKLILDKSAATMAYSLHSNAIDYTGLKYVYNREAVNNEINTYLLDWYEKNVKSYNLDNYVVNYNFCNDSSYRRQGSKIWFGAYDRLADEEKKPSAICPATKADFGGAYNQKVGLITADEVVLAGGEFGINNYNYFLYNGGSFFTSSPLEFQGNKAYMAIVTNTGSLESGKTDEEYDVRPVINIISSLTYEGSGTAANPYVINIK